MPKTKKPSKRSTKPARRSVPDLQLFLQNNPWSKIEPRRDRVDVILPWNDSTLIISIPRREYANAGHLDPIILPERFNGLYHTSEKRFELIFNSLFDKDEPNPSDAFKFCFRGKTYDCFYGEPSVPLLFLARCHEPVVTSATSSSYRNLDNLQILQEAPLLPSRAKTIFGRKRGLSFFIEPIDEYKEDDLVSLCKHLNFYVSYFERQSPQIQIIPVGDAGDESEELPLQRSLPGIINAAELDQFLLDLNLAAREVELRLTFLYYYQILEYSAFYWVEDSVKGSVCKILRAPDLQAKIDEYFPKLIEALNPTRQQDEHKIRKVIEASADPRRVWSEVKQDIPYFASAQKFDGGFELEALISKDTTEDTFVKMWMPKLLDQLKSIRNSLVHARESRTQCVISPTAGNDRLLKPWLPIIRLIAEQVTIFEL